jgi:hypothetical protein
MYAIVAILVLLSWSAFAACTTSTPPIASLDIVLGSAPVHIGVVDLNSKTGPCRSLPPAGINLSSSGTQNVVSATQDGTGWMLTGLVEGFSDVTLTSNASGSIPAILHVNVNKPVQVGVTSP